MAQLIINVPDAVLPRVLNGFSTFNNYSPTIPDLTDPLGQRTLPNPETKAQFCKRKIIEYIMESVRTAEVRAASEISARNASTSVDSDINLT